MTGESIHYWRPGGRHGLEVMTVQRSARLWRSVHAQVSLCVVLAGAGQWRHGGVVHEFRPGTTRVLAPGEVHQDLRLDAPTSRVVVFVAPALVAGLARQLGLAADPCSVTSDDPACAAALRPWAEPVPDSEVDERLRATLRALLLRAAQQRPAATQASSAVRQAQALLHQRFDEPLALDEVAGATGLSKPRLVRAFHAEVGLPPFEYLMHVRVARAREGLRAGRSAADAASTCGFCDQSHLTRWFKKVVGVTPGQYARAEPSNQIQARRGAA